MSEILYDVMVVFLFLFLYVAILASTAVTIHLIYRRHHVPKWLKYYMIALAWTIETVAYLLIVFTR